MPKRGQSSFRRLLLSRILLLSLPVLLVGQYVTYRKARSALLETARLNLTESAVKKAAGIDEWAKSLRSSLILVAHSSVLQSGEEENFQGFLEEVVSELPFEVNCLQMTNLETNEIVASTCGLAAQVQFPQNLWSATQSENWTVSQSEAHIINVGTAEVDNGFFPENIDDSGSDTPETRQVLPRRQNNQLSLISMAPVYIADGEVNRLRYGLSLESYSFLRGEQTPKSLTGSTVILDDTGTIVAHPNPQSVGLNIRDHADSQRLDSLLRSALAGRTNFIHLFSFQQNGEELLAGYHAIDSPVFPKNDDSKWVILAVASLDDALYGLKDINSVLVVLIMSLIIAIISAALYLSRDLARPLEKLRDYALQVNSIESHVEVPKNLKIREVEQLAQALRTMVDRLQSRAQALAFATKEARVANQLKDEFLRVISHELRTPLNGIINSLNLIQDGFCDDRDEEMEYLQMANDSALHLFDIVNDILDIALIEEGQLSLFLEPTDLGVILQEAIALQTLDIQQKGLDLNLVLSAEPLEVQADRDKLKQVFLNIINNAVKFTQAGSITITSQLERFPNAAGNAIASNYNSGQIIKASEQVIVTIVDTGIGVIREKQSQLFQPFVMVDGSTTRESGGVGLGLAIARRLMEMMGGGIQLYSAGHDQGTTVTIAMPTLRAATPPSQHQKTTRKSKKKVKS
ncbi:two-component sensor histidine kinase [Limnospira fusiformis CCALA 023]|uniref:sensor histidine kinase n=1 Tax=Oscillatoriales TaxID=1150 RepID=UPI00396EEB5A